MPRGRPFAQRFRPETPCTSRSPLKKAASREVAD
jgi:hypothetical protein